jgi:biotin operon repressor
MAKRKRKRKSLYRPPRSFARQPVVAKVIKLLRRTRGVSANELARVLGWKQPSVRSVIVRLRQAGAPIEAQWEWNRGGKVYRLSRRFSGPRDATVLTKAQAAKLQKQRGFKPKASAHEHRAIINKAKIED